MELDKEMRVVLGSITSDKAVHAQAMLELIDKAESRDAKVTLLEIALTERDKVEKHVLVLKNKGLEPGVWSELTRKHGEFVLSFCKNAFFTTANSKEFADEILRLLDFFRTPEEKAFCLGVVMYDTNIVPYHNLPGKPLKISNEEYKNLLLANRDKAELMGYLVELPFYDWNEAASIVLQVMDTADDRRLRIALLSYFMMVKAQRIREAK